MRVYESPDGVRWGVTAEMPGASNIMVVFHYPTGRSARLDRYAWFNADLPEARNVTARLDPDAMLERFTDADLARLFRRSMRVSADDNPLGTPVTSGA